MEKYPGVLASLLMLDKLSIEDIKASITELMAGGVDTVINLNHLLYETDCVFFVKCMQILWCLISFVPLRLL